MLIVRVICVITVIVSAALLMYNYVKLTSELLDFKKKADQYDREKLISSLLWVKGGKL